MKLRILITGSTGFIGRHLLERLEENRNYEIFCLNKNPGHSKSAKFISGDITDEESLKKIPRVDVAIHLAALKYHYENGKEMYRVNVEGTRNLLKYVKCKQLIFSSTVVAADPHDDYGKSKSMCEKIIRNSRVNYTILRFSAIFGNDDDTNITKIIKIVKKFPVVPVVGSGKQLMQPLFINDCTKIIELCMMNKKTFRKTYFAVGQTISLNDLIRLTEQSFNLKRMKIHFPIRLLTPFIALYEKISAKPFVTKNQLNNYDRELIFEPTEINKDLEFYPSPLISSIKKSV
jgi:nucleoside-diphosphate-sugar epimerase